MCWSRHPLSLPEFEARIDHHDRKVKKNISVSNTCTRPTSKNKGTNLDVRLFANIVRACVGDEFRDYITQQFPPVVV
jgi:hypothetical protein